MVVNFMPHLAETCAMRCLMLKAFQKHLFDMQNVFIHYINSN